MTSSSEFTSSATGDQTSQQTKHEDLIYRLAQLMRAEVVLHEFEKTLLEYAVRGLNGQGGVLWKCYRE